MDGPDPVLESIASGIDTEALNNRVVVVHEVASGATKSMKFSEMRETYGELEQIDTMPWTIAGETRDVPIFGAKAAKTDSDGFPASSFLVVEDPNNPSTWHLKYRQKDGKTFDPGLAGGAWAALTDPNGFRGKQYSGPDKQKAIDKLTAAYHAEGLKTPDEKEKGGGSKGVDPASAGSGSKVAPVDGQKATPEMVSCPNKSCNGKFPEGTKKCPTCGKMIVWNGATPSLASDSDSDADTDSTPDTGGQKSLELDDGMTITRVKEGDVAIYVVKDAEGDTQDYVAGTAENPITVRLTKDRPLSDSMALAQKIAASVAEKDWDDDGEADAVTNFASILDPDDKIWDVFDSLWDGTLDAIDAVDDLQLATGKPGIDRDQVETFLNQCVAACMARYDAMQETGVATKEAKNAFLRKFNQVAPLVYMAIREKAGARHSASDLKHLTAAHDAIAALGYNGCQPLSGQKDGVRTKSIGHTGSPDGATESEVIRLKGQLALTESELAGVKEVKADLEKQLETKSVEAERIHALRNGKHPLADPTVRTAEKPNGHVDPTAPLEAMTTSDYIKSLEEV